MRELIGKPKDHDFIQSRDDFFFCVIGYTHPKDRIVSYLKYIPHSEGKWKLGSISLKRVLDHYSAVQVLKSQQYLGKSMDDYLFECPVTKIKITAVPNSLIKNYYQPQVGVEKLRDLHEKNQCDELQKKAIEFIEFLANQSSIKIQDFGITGSILTNFHNVTFSDIDLTIHGRANSKLVERTVFNCFEDKKSELTRLKPEIAREWQINKMNAFKFNESQARILYERKWNMGIYKNTRFSIHPIRNDDEILYNYGDLEFFPRGIIEIEGTVIKEEDSMFLPCKYEVSDVKIREGEEVGDLNQVCSFEGLYCFMVKNGEQFKARGKLEKVIDKKNDCSYHRLLIGSYLAKSRDYLMPITN